MSKFEKIVKKQLKELFPNATLKEQYHVKKGGGDLFFDFFLPHLNLLIECQGEQHYQFNSHYHEDEKAFKEYQRRDSLKREWAEDNEKILLEIKFNEVPTNAQFLFWYIHEAIGNAQRSTI